MSSGKRRAMTTATQYTLDDLERLQELLAELTRDGRREEANVLARVHATIAQMVYEELFADDDNDELMAALEEADADIDAGNFSTHEEVLKRLGMSDNE